MHQQSVEIAEALRIFDRVESNLVKMERICSRFEGVGEELVGSDDPELVVLLDRWRELVEALPEIDGFKVTATPLLPTQATEWKVHLGGLPLIEESMEFWSMLAKPEEELAIYRSRMEQARLRLMRSNIFTIVDDIDGILDEVTIDYESRRPTAHWECETRWMQLEDLFNALVRLTGSHVPRKARWIDFQRHLHFATPHDLYDIVKLDWPSVKAELGISLYGDFEPIPIRAEDLGEIALSPPDQTPVATRIDWGSLSDHQFEAVIFEIIRSAEGYENANWPMKTNAPDRGRDIEAYRVIPDALSKTRRLRVMIQCKHWQSRSIGRSDLIQSIEAIKLWEPPPIDVVIVATSGRFSQDAVAVAERKEAAGRRPLIELWPDSHIEGLLGQRPNILAQFGLR